MINVVLKSNPAIYDSYTVNFQNYEIVELKITKELDKLAYMIGEELNLLCTEELQATINVNEIQDSFKIRIVDSYVTGFVITDKEDVEKKSIGDSQRIYCAGEVFFL